MDELRRCWKVPYIVYYCNLFAKKLDLVDLKVDEFEEAIIDDCGQERNVVIIHLLQKLVKPFVIRAVDLTNYEQLLLQVLRRYNLEHLFLQYKPENTWRDLSMLNKLDIIYNLCELRLLLNDIENKVALYRILNLGSRFDLTESLLTNLKEYDVNDLRIEPIGIDSLGNTLWYFGDLRLYEEKPRKPEKKEAVKESEAENKKSKQSNNNKKRLSEPVKTVNKKPVPAPTKSTRSTRRSVALSKQEDDEEDENDETEEKEIEVKEEEIGRVESEESKLKDLEEDLKYWQCICISLDDWESVHKKFKSSKKKADQEIAKLLEQSYLPEMPSLYQRAEKERQQRLLMMQPKRSSQRLQNKIQQSMSECDDESSQNAQDATSTTNNFQYHDGLLTIEQERQRKEEIARQREERFKQRLLKKETSQSNDDDDSSQNLSLNGTHIENNDENSQASLRNLSSSDFNTKNFLLMQKVLNKVLQSKYAWPFKEAVSEEDAPDYSEIIDNPMDLTQIQTKINKKLYKSRQEFSDDLDLIAHNCLKYNGDDSFYGKIALKFVNYNKRWLNIFYPREISTSLEEKNRQLMNLINGTTNENESNENSNIDNQQNDDSLLLEQNSQTSLTDLQNDPNLILEVDSMGNSIIRKRRKQNPDKDKYIQEPQYVTKQTSSGRLVKMKISTDFNYESDEDGNKQQLDSDGQAKRRKRDHDDSTREGIQIRHIKNRPELEHALIEHEHEETFASETESEKSSNSDNSNDDDDDDFAQSKRKSTYVRKTNRPYRRRTVSGGVGAGLNSMPKKRNTIKNLTENMNLSLNRELEASIGQKISERLNSGQTLTVGQVLAVNDALKSKINLSYSSKLEPNETSGINRPKLTVPMINPIYKNLVQTTNGTSPSSLPASLSSSPKPFIINQVLNPNSSNSSPKIIKLVSQPLLNSSIDASNDPSRPKKVLILNSTLKPASLVQTGQQNQSQNVVKIISISNANSVSALSSTGNKVLVIKNPNEINQVNNIQNNMNRFEKLVDKTDEPEKVLDNANNVSQEGIKAESIANDANFVEHQREEQAATASV